MNIIEEINNLYRIIELKPFRKTEGVLFDLFPMESIEHIDSIDRVLHDNGAVSPGPIGSVRPWYMHPHQDDNLIVLHGRREVDIYNQAHGKVEHFTVYPDKIFKDDKLIYNGGAILVWPAGVFHRIVSGEDGSASLNLAVHHVGFNIQNNFNIYDLNTDTGEYQLIREGYKDQV